MYEGVVPVSIRLRECTLTFVGHCFRAGTVLDLVNLLPSCYGFYFMDI